MAGIQKKIPNFAAGINVTSMLHRIFIAAAVAALISACGGNQSKSSSSAAASQNVNKVRVYTHRNYTVDQQLFSQFTARTGVEVEVVKDTDEALLDRLKAESGQAQADVYIASNAYYLEQARLADVLQPFSTQMMSDNVPSRYRDNNGNWTALGRNAVGLAVAIGKADISKLNYYSDLASPVWRNQLLLGNPNRPSTLGLVAGLIATEGEAAAAKWVSDVVKNRLPGVTSDSEYDLIKALAEGKGTLALVQANAVLQMKASGNPEFTMPAEKVGFIFLKNKEDKSVFYVTGAGLVRDAPHRDFAVMLLEFLTGEEQQQPFTGATLDFPINPMSLPNDFLYEIGGFFEIKPHLNTLTTHYGAAANIMKQANWTAQ